jgi:hypothetical protein
MSFIQCTKQVQTTTIIIGIAVLLTSCFRPAFCPAYVDKDFIKYKEYDLNEPYECSTWYEDPFGYSWATDSKSLALMKWTEITNRPMDFNLSGNFTYSVTASDGFKYYFWNMVFDNMTQYHITVQKLPEGYRTTDI